MDDKVFVPPIKIQGIKTKLVPLIKQNVLIDADTIWVEPFMGSGVVGFNIAPNVALFADTNPHLINFYNALKEKSIDEYIVRAFLEEEGEKLAKLDAEYYYEVRNRFNQSHAPLDFLFLNRSCFNGMIRFNRTNDFNVPYGHKPERFSKAYITKIANQVKHVQNEISRHDWTFVCQSFEITIANAPEKAFIYCDPPYIGRHVDYFDSWDEDLEKQLCDLLMSCHHPFMLSTWEHNDFRRNEYVDTIWRECHRITHDHFYHLGAQEKNRNPIVEALLTNYVPTDDSNSVQQQAITQLSFLKDRMKGRGV